MLSHTAPVEKLVSPSRRESKFIKELVRQRLQGEKTLSWLISQKLAEEINGLIERRVATVICSTM